MLLTTQGLNSERSKEILIEAGLLASENAIQAELLESTLLKAGLNKEEREEILNKLGLIQYEGAEAIVQGTCTKADLEAVLAQKLKNAEDAEGIIKALGLAGANAGETVSFELLTKAIWKNIAAMAKWLVTTPAGWATLAIGAVVGLTVAYANLASTAESAAKAQEELKEAESDLASARDELTGINDKIAEIKSKGGELGISDQAELDRLETERAILEDQVRLLELKKELAADKSNREAVKAVMGNKKEAWWTDSDDKIIRDTTGYTDSDDDGNFETYSGPKSGSVDTTIGGYEKEIEEIEKEISEWESKPDSEKKTNKLVRLGEKKQEVQDKITENKDKLIDIYLRDTELMGQITGDDPASVAAREKLQKEMDFLEQYIYTKEQLAKIKFDDFIKDPNNKAVSEGFKDIQKDGEVTAQEITDLANKFPALSKYMSENGITAEVLAAEYSKVSDESKNASENANKMTDSLDSLSSAIKAAESAFELFNEVEKDFNSTGAISSENIQKILNKFPELEDELYEYIMGMRTGASVMDLLKTKSDDMATMSADAFKRMYLSSNGASEKIIKHADNMFDAIGLGYKSELSIAENINSQIIESNGTVCTTFQEQWGNAVKNAGGMLQAFASGFSNLLTGTFFNGEHGVYTDRATGDWYNKSQYDENGDGYKDTVSMTDIWAEKIKEENKGISDEEARKRANNAISSYAAVAKKNNEQIEADKKAFDEKMKELAARGGDSGSDKNEVLDNYLKDAENRYKIHQDETRYIQELQWAHDNLTKDEKERLDIIGKINEAYRDLADNRIKDLKHQIDLKKELHGEDYDVTTELAEIQKVAHEEADRYREFARKELGYYNEGTTDEQKAEIDELIEKTNEIQGNQKTWWDTQNEKLEWRLNNSKNYIEQRNKFGDWHLFDDNEVDAWERVIKWLKEDYPDAVDELKEAEENLFEARKEQFNKATDLASSYYDSKKTLLQSYYDVTNSIAEAQHEINKELATSKTMYEWLDKETQILLFNQEDYNILSEELYDIQYKADKLRRQYEYDLEHSSLSTIEEITSQYEMQYETLMKSYEIAKADLEIAKKKQKLNNVLNERNVRMFINGQWQWVANTQDVIDAKSELADAEYAKRTAEAGLRQTESINDLTAKQDKLGTVISKFENGVITLDDAIKEITQKFKDLPNDVLSALNSAKSQPVTKTQQPTYSSGGSGSSSGASTKNATATIPGLGKVPVYIDSSGKTQTGGLKAGTIVHTAGGDYKITGGTAGNYTSEKVNKHASGTRYTPGGLTELGEKGNEMYIDNNGHLIPINQHMFGNIGSGGIVFNQDQMDFVRNIWDWANVGNIPSNLINNKSQTISSTTDNRIIINGMTIDGNSSDGRAVIEALRRVVANH